MSTIFVQQPQLEVTVPLRLRVYASCGKVIKTAGESNLFGRVSWESCNCLREVEIGYDEWRVD
jgi:hypothetical protein